MPKLLFAFAVSALVASPALAQAAPEQAAPAPKVKTVKKTVCKRIETDGETGSRLGATSKICREVEVPVKQDSGEAAANERSANTI